MILTSWFVGCIVVGIISSLSKDGNFWGGFILSILITPVLAFFATLICLEPKN